MAHAIDLAGQHFGRLVVLERAPNQNGRVFWNCKCECGNVCTSPGETLRDGRTRSCGCLHKGANTVDLIGRRFSSLVVIEQAPNLGDRVHWFCQCDCGQLLSVRGSALREGNTKSCGCGKEGKPPTHGYARRGKHHPSYGAWCAMRRRCEKTYAHNYEYYGGRGIKVCDRWQSFENFLADMGERPEGLTLDRINNEGDYEPSNCKWSTQSEQMLNSRRARQSK
jgi:hypothetical protein